MLPFAHRLGPGRTQMDFFHKVGRPAEAEQHERVVHDAVGSLGDLALEGEPSALFDEAGAGVGHFDADTGALPGDSTA